MRREPASYRHHTKNLEQADALLFGRVTYEMMEAVQQFKRESGKGLFVGGVKLHQALSELGLIDGYEFVVHPRLPGHGPTLFAGLSKYLDLKLVRWLEFRSGAVAMWYEPRR